MAQTIIDQLDHYREVFGRAVNSPRDTHVKIDTRLEGIAKNLQNLGRVIDPDTKLHESYMAAAKHCQSQIAGMTRYEKARSVLATILTPVSA